MPSEQRVKLIATMDVARDQLGCEWQTVETVLREYTDGHDKMSSTMTARCSSWDSSEIAARLIGISAAASAR